MLGLTFIGDIFPGDELFTSGFGFKSKTNGKNIGLWTKNIHEVIGEANYIVGNLESPLVDDKEAKGHTFYGIPLFSDVLKDSGINILNVANNHILEHGANGFTHTLDTLHNKQLLTIGEMGDGHSKILKIQHEGTTICMAGFCDERVCNFDNPQCYASLEEEMVFKTLENMKALHPDVIVFVFHWGDEYIHIPSPEQRKLAYKLIDHGAHLIVGHHPHVIQPYEQYQQGHIIYSLGNFCFDDVQSAHFAKGMIARVNIQQRAIRDISFKGVLVQDQAYTDSLVLPMDDRAFKRYFSRINEEYARLQQMPEETYQCIYKERHQRAHSKERIFMRLSLAKKIIDLRHRHKKQLLNNVKKYILH